LEGSITPATLIEIDPALTASEVEDQYRFTTFPGFLEAYKWTVRRLRAPDHYRLAARRLRERLAAEGIEQAEINVSVGVMVWREQDAAANLQAIREELPGFPLIFDAVRQHGGEMAVQVAELACEFGCGFGVGGDEGSRPMSEFATAVIIAHGRFYPHAGETTNARNVWEALEQNPRRIGHGIRAIEDAALLTELRDRDIALEICLSSNVATGAVASLADHPAKRLFDAGVPLVLNTDDPAMFGTNLRREYELAAQIGFSLAELERLRQNAFQYSSERWSRLESAGE
jgi:adenosine deaminase/aminodeoxyfutalosine deaminase